MQVFQALFTSSPKQRSSLNFGWSKLRRLVSNPSRKRHPKDAKIEAAEHQPNYITSALPNGTKNYKNRFDGESNALRWSQEEMDIQQTIKIPQQVCQREWLATHILSLYNNIKLVYELIGQFCTPATCPKMCGVRGELFYQETGNKRDSHITSAPAYMDWAFTKCTEIVGDQAFFPTKYGEDFSPQFESELRRMARILYAVCSHIYANHFVQLQQQQDMHLYLNTLFIHLVLLGDEYGLIECAERQGLDDLIAILAPKGSITTSSNHNYVTTKPQPPEISSSITSSPPPVLPASSSSPINQQPPPLPQSSETTVNQTAEVCELQTHNNTPSADAATALKSLSLKSSEEEEGEQNNNSEEETHTLNINAATTAYGDSKQTNTATVFRSTDNYELEAGKGNADAQASPSIVQSHSTEGASNHRPINCPGPDFNNNEPLMERV